MKKIVKTVLSMTLSLTVAASFMGSVVQADAQEVSDRSVGETHHLVYDGCSYEYEEANSEYHFVNRKTYWHCVDSGCNVTVQDVEEGYGYEKHNLRDVTQPPERFYCIDCGYRE